MTDIERNIDIVTRLVDVVHEGQVRKGSGDPYSGHPKDVLVLVKSLFLSPFSPDQQTEAGIFGVDTLGNAYNFIVCSATLLHDAIEDGKWRDKPITMSILAGLLRFERACVENEAMLIAELVHQLTSLDKVGPVCVSDQNRAKRKELMRERVQFMSVPGIAIKACDRLDNTKKLSELEPKFALKYAQESIELFDILRVYLPKQHNHLHEAVMERQRELSLFVKENS